MPPESSQTRAALAEGLALSLMASRAASTHSRGMPESGTGTAIHSERGFSVTLLWRRYRRSPSGPLSATWRVNDVQVAQGQEILEGPANTNRPVILAGDYNTRAGGGGTPTYDNLINSGFTDAWSVKHPGVLGNTWGHQEDLRDTTTELTQRLDLVLFRDGPPEDGLCAVDADVIADNLSDRTPSGLWPSDHAGVVA